MRTAAPRSVPTGTTGHSGAPETTVSGGPAPRRWRREPSWRRRQKARPWALLLPALLVLAVVLAFPLFRVVQLSFQDYGLRQVASGEQNYTGLANYREILSSPFLWQTVLPNTVVFAVVCVVLTMVVGTVVALFLNTLPRSWRTLCLTAVMIAWAVPAVTGTYVYVWLFDPLNGLVSTVLTDIGLIEPGTVNWFADRVTFYAIATLNVVQHGFPFVAVTVLSGLMTVPKELYEAAEIDGASAWRRFWSVTVPVLKPVFAVCMILSTIWDFKVFTQIYLMPGGNGGNPSVYNLGVWSYIESFAQSRYGMGSAIAVLLTAILLLITVVYMRTLFKEAEEL